MTLKTPYIVDNNGCWLWQGAVNWKGYGIVRRAGRTCRAHRHMWEASHGPIPDEMLICHKCDVRSCVNPDHLFLGTASDNALDAVRKGRWRWNRKPSSESTDATSPSEAAE